MKRKHLALLCALVLVTLAPFSLLGCGGCAGSRHEGEGAKDQTTRDGHRRARRVARKGGPGPRS